MTDETEKMVLQPLRGTRADTGALRSRVERRSTAVEVRPGTVEAVEARLDGVRYALAASAGSIATDPKDHHTCVVAFEGARV